MRAPSSDATSPGCATGIDASPEFERACLLLLLGQHPASSRELCERLHGSGLADTERSQVDDVLRAFEALGLVDATSAAEAGRTYRLTPAGVAQLGSAADDLRSAQVMLGWFLARCGEHVVLDARSIR